MEKKKVQDTFLVPTGKHCRTEKDVFCDHLGNFGNPELIRCEKGYSKQWVKPGMFG